MTFHPPENFPPDPWKFFARFSVVLLQCWFNFTNVFENPTINGCTGPTSSRSGRFQCKIASDDVINPFVPKNDRHVPSLGHRVAYPETRIDETYTPIPHTAHFPEGSDPLLGQKGFSVPFRTPPWALASETNPLRSRIKLSINFSMLNPSRKPIRFP